MIQMNCTHCGAPIENQEERACRNCGQPVFGLQGEPFIAASYPTQKVPLGGWLLFYFVLNCLTIVSTMFSFVSGIMAGTFSILQFLFSAATVLLPAVMILYNMVQRSIKFKGWFYFQAVVSLLSCVLLVISGIALAVLSSTFQAEISEILLATAPQFPVGLLSVVGVVLLAVGLLGLAFQIAWLVYFNKSRRVAYTFDPRNNPPH